MTIGRGRDCDIRLTDQTVSRLHAVLIAGDDGHRIEDRNSLNAVRINDIEVNTYTLRGGELIELGAVKLTYEVIRDIESGQKEEWRRRYRKVETLLQEENPGTYTSLADDEFVTLHSQHFHIRFHVKKDGCWISRIYRTLERAHRKVGEHLDCYPSKVPVEVYSTDEEMIKAGCREGKRYPEWAVALYDGLIRIKTADTALSFPEDMYIILTHEYVHLVVDHKTHGNCPFWLNEGIAQTEAQELPPDAEQILREAARGKALIPLRTLEGRFDELPEKGLVDMAYIQSHSVVEYMLREYDWKGILKVLEGLSLGEDISQALKLLSTTYEELERNWQRWLTNIC